MLILLILVRLFLSARISGWSLPQTIQCFLNCLSGVESGLESALLERMGLGELLTELERRYLDLLLVEQPLDNTDSEMLDA